MSITLSLNLQWLKSQCVECNQKKGFLETVEKCAISDPGKIPSIAELILMLNETETTIPKIHPVVRERREDTKSSLYQVYEHSTDCLQLHRICLVHFFLILYMLRLIPIHNMML